MPDLSIIIPTYNGLEHLRCCLPSVVAHSPSDTQILVVDDGSSDGTVEWVTSQFSQIELVRLPGNLGFCGAVNEGIRRAKGDVVELLNNDTEVAPGWAERCLRHFQDNSVGSVAPLVLRMDAPDVIDSAGQEYHVCGWATDRGHGQSLTGNHLSSCEVFGTSGSSGFYRRSALQKTGGLLPEYGAYFEDTDLAFRLRWAGYRCIYEPESRVFHKGSASYHQKSARVIRLLSRNEELVWWINLPLAQILLGLLPHLGFFLVRVLRKIPSGGIMPFLHGKLQAMSHWGFILKRRKMVRTLRDRRAKHFDLSLSRSASVLKNGLVWLARRQCP